MRASLGGWTDFTPQIEDEIRAILARTGASDTSTAACKAWARELVTSLAPTWEPGRPLTVAAAQRVGEAFERLAASANPSIAEATRRKTTRSGAERKPYTRKRAETTEVSRCE